MDPRPVPMPVIPCPCLLLFLSQTVGTFCADITMDSNSTWQSDRLVGLVVKASASRAEGPGFESRLRRDFFGVESYL